MARGAIGRLRINSNPAEKHENDNDQENQTHSSGWRISPVSAVSHLGSAPKSAKSKNTINMVPSIFHTSLSGIPTYDLVQPFFEAAPTAPLHRDADRDSNVGIPAVVQVIAVVNVDDVNVVVVVPVIPPVFRPWVNGTDPIASVLEAWVSAHNHEGEAVDSESMVLTKVPAETVVRDAIAV